MLDTQFRDQKPSAEDVRERILGDIRAALAGEAADSVSKDQVISDWLRINNIKPDTVRP